MANLGEHILICFLTGFSLGAGAMVGVFVINAYEDYMATEHNRKHLRRYRNVKPN